MDRFFLLGMIDCFHCLWNARVYCERHCRCFLLHRTSCYVHFLQATTAPKCTITLRDDSDAQVNIKFFDADNIPVGEEVCCEIRASVLVR